MVFITEVQMIKRIMRSIKLHSFSVKSERRLYIALVTGILISMLPISGIRWILIPLLSLAFSLNFLIMMVGVALVTLFPMVHLLSYGIASRISPVPLPDFTSKALALRNLMQGTPGSVPFLLGSLIGGLAVSLAILPLYSYIYRRDSRNRNVSHAVFHDATGKRLRVVRRTRLLMVIVLPAVVLLMGLALNAQPSLPDINLEKPEPYVDIPSPIVSSPGVELTEGDTSTVPPEGKLSSRGYFDAEDQGIGADSKVFAFYSQLNEHGRVSLEENIGGIDIVIPDWFSLEEDLTLTGDAQKDILELLVKNGVKNMPVIRNLSKDAWNGDLARRLIHSPQQTERFIRDLVDRLESSGSSGVIIDFENLDPKDRDAYTAFIRTVNEALHRKGRLLAVTIPAGEMESYDVETLAQHADYLLALLYDENYSTSAPGPVASQAWVESAMERLGAIPKEKIVPVFANFGYDWDLKGEEPARFLTFTETLSQAGEGDLKIAWHDEKLNPYFRYRKADRDHEVWFLDAATLYNGMRHAASEGIPNIGVFALGMEDSGIWTYLGKGKAQVDPARSLKVILSSAQVRHTDMGDILRIGDTRQQEGRRNIKTRDGMIVRETYETYPSYYEVAKYGKPEGKKVALTFDDGPNRKYTPRILDILSQYNAPSTFFVIGINALSNQELLERIYKEGHEIGNHTFTHADTAKVSDFRLKLELSLTQRVIQDVIGHSTLLFRPPGSLDTNSLNSEDYLPIVKTQQLGYTMVGESIDPRDWADPTSEEIFQHVMDSLPDGNVILLHDSGGDRESTVEALPRILEELKRQGYEFVTVSSLIGKTTAEIMPAVGTGDSHFVLYTKSAMVLLFGLLAFMGYIFLTTTVLGAFRLLFLVYFSKKQHRRMRREVRDTGFRPSVSVVIAAYNEEKVIVSTLRSVLESTYGDLEVIVVDDGSTDGTSHAIEAAFRDDRRVILLQKANGGKSSALNLGFRKASGEIVVAFDADTVVNREAISLMVSHFADETVGAVSGNVKVGNVHNLLTKWQYIEYVIGFNLERRAFAELGCITVVPGAIGAWRKAYVKACGYFKSDTLAEDTDMTLALLRQGYSVRYEEKALAYTEAPGDLKSFMKQRYRWSYGILQSLWKNRDMMFDTGNKTLGFIALPNMWLFQYVFQTLSPLADLILIFGLFSSRAPVFIAYYLVLLLLDYMTAIYAFRLEKLNIGILVWLFLQRIIYRAFMVYTNFKAIFNAMKGLQVGWNKLKRKGDVKRPESAKSYS
jgi:cellulose synthase/poly-beta-1,6-N-acetylglucosamine synthase-like glycosyltransferase/spore germination protein YaaH/peptidoglycan/xylan/chitin deacetylase (PgdA/CDA1 family)